MKPLEFKEMESNFHCDWIVDTDKGTYTAEVGFIGNILLFFKHDHIGTFERFPDMVDFATKHYQDYNT